ncbi:MAG: type II secretion system F family protein [Lachnospiraceae bacterium]|nr:type II secretion system F family protein [Lachnospiraceae bacterium]
MSFMCTQIAGLLGSGLQITDCVGMIQRETSDRKLSPLLESVYRDLRSGSTVASAFANNGEGLFKPFFIETVRAGESSGELKRAFDSLAEYYRKRSGMKRQIRNALIYPSFVILIAIAVLLVVMLYVMPKLTAIFDGMGSELPGITKAIVAVSGFFGRNALLIAGAAALVIVVRIAMGRKIQWRRKIDKARLSLPMLGGLLRNRYSSMYASTLSMLLSSGTVITRALEITSSVITNTSFSEAVSRSCRGVLTGRGLGVSMRGEEVFPDILTEMIIIGEETGDLTNMLDMCARHFSDEADSQVKKLLSLMEPALLIAVAIIAGFIVFAIYIPLFQMYELF